MLHTLPPFLPSLIATPRGPVAGAAGAWPGSCYDDEDDDDDGGATSVGFGSQILVLHMLIVHTPQAGNCVSD